MSYNPKVCVYTVLVGGYDRIIEPQEVDPNIDFICFVGKTESSRQNSTIWEFVEIESDLKDLGRLSRIPKLLPHKTCIANYDYSLYIDANILIRDKSVYERINDFVSKEIKIGLLQHPFRDCVYQEAYVCIASLKGGWLDIVRQICFLRWKGVPKHCGLFEANVIFRKHNDPIVVAMDELWWKTFMRFSKRDQLSLVYALREENLSVSYFLPPGQTTRNNSAFKKINHLAQKKNRDERIKGGIIRFIFGISKKLLKE